MTDGEQLPVLLPVPTFHIKHVLDLFQVRAATRLVGGGEGLSSPHPPSRSILLRVFAIAPLLLLRER